MTDIGLLRHEAWLLMCDLSELMSNDEKKGGAVRPDSSFWDFRNMAENCKLKEVRFTSNMLSWGGKWIMFGLNADWIEA